jgi:uncharacterized protein (TIGR00297 family)
MLPEGNDIYTKLVFLVASPFIIIKSSISDFLLTIILSSLISILSYKFKLLNFRGTIAIFSLAFFIFGLGGWKWTIPILVFFLSSSLLSNLKGKAPSAAGQYNGKSAPRNDIQVLANGGIAGILVILNYFFPSELFYVVFVSSVAAVCADTWSTETGTFKQTATVNILSFKKIQQGMSGGISFPGTIGGMLGASIVAVSSLLWLGLKHINYIIFIIFAGIIGNLFDSILGASLQAKYRCNLCSEITERSFHCGQNSSLIKGFKIINNDVVNFATAAVGGLFGFLFIQIF